MNEIPRSASLLSFEWDEKAERLEIHGNRQGLEHLVTLLESLLRADENDHVHLMTPQWGGGELSSEQQNPEAVLVNHVKILHWKSAASTSDLTEGER
jgi:hypothetical protein